MDAAPRVDALEAALRRVWRGVLALLATCGVLIAFAEASDTDTGPASAPRSYSVIALAFASGSIVSRLAATSPAAGRRLRVYGRLAGLLLAGALGPLGVALALGEGQRTAALLYTLAGALFVLRATPGGPESKQRGPLPPGGDAR